MIWEVAVSKELPCKAEDGNCFDHIDAAVQWVEQTYIGFKFGDFSKLPMSLYFSPASVFPYMVYVVIPHKHTKVGNEFYY